MEESLSRLLDFGKSLINEAGVRASYFYGRGLKKKRFDEEVVTATELAVLDLFRNAISSSFPEHGIFGQGNLEPKYTHSGKRYLWVFDPLDGVANFQAGLPIWGLSLGLMENFWPLFGICFFPATNDLFVAGPDGLATHNGETITDIPNPREINDESMLFVYSRFHRYYTTDFPGKVRNLGSTLAHLCYVAMGIADGAIIRNESFENLLAAEILNRNAGKRMYRLDGSEYHVADGLEGPKVHEDILVTSPNLVKDILGYINPIS